MDVALIIEHLYPNAVMGTSPGDGDYVLVGGEISYWNEARLGPQPTERELLAAWKPAVAQQKKGEFVRHADSGFRGIFPSRVEFDYIVVRRLQGRPITAQQQGKADQVLTLFDKLTRGAGTVDTFLADGKTTAEEIRALRWETI